MPNQLSGYIDFKRASRHYNVSRSTLDRRRDKARENDPTTYACFVLQTRSGEIIRTPAKEKVEQLIKSSEAPQWYVSKTWLEKEYGRRQVPSGQGSGESAPPDPSQSVAALKEQYEARIADLKEQLETVRLEKKEILQFAHEDKQLLAKATEGLTQVLALPGIAEATKAQRGDMVLGVSPESPASKPSEQRAQDQNDQQPHQGAEPGRDLSPEPKTRRRLWNWFAKSST